MSHYFDDESALEELLNQQLNRAKRASDTNAVRKIQNPPSQASVSQAPFSSARPSTIDNKGKPELSRIEDGVHISRASDTSTTTNRLASWLDGGSSKRVQSIPSDTGRPSSISAIDNVRGLESNGRVIEGLEIGGNEESFGQNLREERLQEMSKQGLIKLIMSQIVPVLNSLRETGSKQLRFEVERLKVDLRSANEALEEAQKYRSQEIQLTETKWSSFIKRLEDKLERCEQELDNRQKLHRESVEELEKEHRIELKELEESHRLRLEEEQRRWEATLKRRDEHYTLELKSKVKIGQELEKVEDLFGEVSRALEGSGTDLKLQLRLLKETLERQKSIAVESNKELAGKTERLCDHYDKFELQMSHLSGSAKHLSELLPKLIEVHNESQLACDKIKLQRDELERRQEELLKQQAELSGRQDRLAEERFQCGIKESRLNELEERLNERLASCEQSLSCLRERQRKLDEEELRLRSERGSLDSKGSHMRRLNVELHLSRQKLDSRAEELNKENLRLASEREVVEGHWRRLRAEWSRLSGLGKRIHGELKQLSMLERTLVCSVCLERLLPVVGGRGSRKLEDVRESSNNKWSLFDSQQSVVVKQLRQRRLLKRAEMERRRSVAARKVDEEQDEGQPAAAEDSSYSDGRQLEEETRYAELVERAY